MSGNDNMNRINRGDQHMGADARQAGMPDSTKESAMGTTASGRTNLNRATVASKRCNARGGLMHRRGFAYIAALLAVVAALFGVTMAWADDLNNTVPSSEASGGSFYSQSINTGFVPNGYTTAAQYGPGYGSYTVDGVVQSQSATSATSFAAGLPLGTIFIDQSKVSAAGGKYKVVSDNTAIIAGLVDGVGSDNKRTQMYDGTREGAIKLEPNKVNRLDGDLYTMTFEDAAILPSGERADLVITYSNARIVIDQRYASAPSNEQYLHGAVYLSRGNEFSRGTMDKTIFSKTSYATAAETAVNTTAGSFGDSFENSKAPTPAVGITMDATYTIVNKNGTPADGTFVFAISGINLDRDPDVGGGNNVNKPLWYSYNSSFGGVDGTEHSFFSEAMSINGGQVSDNVYLRPNNNLEDNPEKITGVKGQYYWPNISKDATTGQIKFISNATNSPSLGGNDHSYNAGFVVLADAAQGLKVTGTGHGGGNSTGTMQSGVFVSKQIWYRYTSSSGAHGSIKTTSEGNYGGKLNDGGDVLEPDGIYDDSQNIRKKATYVVAEGKTVTYTMTPDVGYKIKTLKLGRQLNPNYDPTLPDSDPNSEEYILEEILFNGQPVSSMKKGDSLTVTTNAGHTGTLTYEDNGTYTFKYEYAEKYERIHVEWEPTTADIYIAKIWDDNDDEDGLRKLLYQGTKPQFKLQASINGGKTWSDVTTNSAVAGTQIHPAKTYASEEVPSGEVGGAYKDGTYYINNDTTGSHPYTWEHLPVYTYDSNGTADRLISYRIVEINNPVVAGEYKSAQFFDAEAFELTSEKSKSWDGWQMYNDPATSTRYVKKGDGLYYKVSVNPSDEAADGIVSPTSTDLTEEEAARLTPMSSNEYRTADKAIPYQSTEILNEHTVRKLYVDVSKFWNDADVKGLETEPAGGNAYERIKLKYILRGTVDDGATTVDLNGDAVDGTDLEITLTPGETKPKNVKVDNYNVFTDAQGTQYVQVPDGDTSHGKGFYKVVNGVVDYSTTAAVTADELDPVINETYKVDDDNFGVYFKDLPTHFDGKRITYTVTEKDASGNDLDGWVVTGGTLNPVLDKSHEVEGYKGDFTNTPRIEDVYETLPIKVAKRDAKTTQVLLEGAEFTVYRNAITGELALDNDDVKIEGQTIYTDGTNEYVKRTEGDPAETKFYTFGKSGDSYTYAVADPQPTETDLKVKNGDVKSNVVTTKTTGYADIEFLEPGTYYVKETKAPTGYAADATIYAFEVDRDLKTVTLEPSDADHDTSWWKMLYDMLFGGNTTSASNWNPETKTLTVDDEPLSANILVRKYWEDNDDQDGVRPKDEVDGQPNPNTPKAILQWTTSAHTATGLPVYEDAAGNKYVHDAAADKFVKVTAEDTVGSFADQAAEPQPDTVSETTETCQGRKVYVDESSNKYVLVDGSYRAVTTVDTTGSVESDPANPQPNESELELVVDSGGEWQTVILGVEDDDPSTPQEEAKAPVTFAGGPVKTNQNDAYTWNDIKAYRDGKVVVYRVTEESPIITDGTYDIKFSHTSDTHEKVFTLVSPDGGTHNQTVDVTNRHETRVINIEAYKTWNDDDPSKRREATLKLWKTVDGATSEVTKIENNTSVPDRGTVPTTDTTDPVKVWSDLPAFEMGYPITYTIEETSIDGYKTIYEVDYAKAAEGTGPATPVKEEGDAIDASVVERTYYTQEDKDAGRIPQGKKVGDESTTAAFRIENEETIDIEVAKTWFDGANSNVTFELWRTTLTEDELTDSAFDEETICYQDADGNRISIQDYNNLPAAEQANYTEVKGDNWSPYDPTDETQTIDGWEKVASHEFAAAPFDNSSEGDTKSYTFEDMPRQTQGTDASTPRLKYLYRVYETPRLVRFATEQTSNTEVTNYNVHAANGIASVEVVKELQGRDWLPTDKFYFELVPESATDKTDSGHVISVDDIPLPARTLERELYQSGDGKYYMLDADNLYREITVTTNPDDSKTYTASDKPANPQPEASDLTDTGEQAEAAIEYPIKSNGDNNKVGAIGRAVDFMNIEFSNEVTVPRGHTVEFNYKVHEVYDALGTSLDEATEHTGKKDGITYAGEVSGGAFVPEEHDLKIVVKNDPDGKMSTEILWDGSSKTGAVPVYTNSYDSSAQVTAHVMKQVRGREITGDDSFYFTITNIAGAPMRATEDTAWNTTDSASHDIANITPTDGTKVTAGTGGYDPADGDGGEYRATKGATSTWIKLSDLTKKTPDGKAYDTFIYELYENGEDASVRASVANDDDLTMDGSRVYLKVVATDNQDGTISVVKTYHSDAACTTSSLIDNKVLVSEEDETIAPAGKTAADEGYAYVPTALFTNIQNIDVPVTKEWVGGPAIEDVTLRLQRKLIPLSAEEGLTYETAESAAGSWEAVGLTMISERGDFMKQDGTPDYDDEATKTSSVTYQREAVPAGATPAQQEAIEEHNAKLEDFNLSLPKYVVEDGVTYRAVYKLVEDDTSSAYETTYRSTKGGVDTAGNRIFIDGETLVVTNKVTATNVARIAAVKQLLGRQWLGTDEFPFVLEKVGVGTYNADGTFASIDDSDEAKAKVPMPVSYVNVNDETDVISVTEYNKLSDDEKANYTQQGTEEATAVATSDKVDPNGNLERLARFDEIIYTINDLIYDGNDGHMQGDFFYTMKEVIPADAVNADGVAYSEADDAQKAAGGFAKGGITYDGDSHTVHVKVRENRTDELQITVAYDEKTPGNITTGTQFTPVYTNKYDAVGEYAQDVNKYIMGRAWNADTDVFDFRMTPLAGAPFEDADRSEFPENDTHSDENRETELEGGKAIHSARGAHVKRMDVDDATQEIQTLTMPKIEFRLSELDKVVTKAEAEGLDGLEYSDGTRVPEGMAYGQFVYSFEETNDYLSKVGKDVKDLNIDKDTEYARVTVIDKGDGTLDHYVEIFEDRYCTVPRYVPGTTDPATSPTFVNQLKRNLSITKAWADTPNSDATMRLQWSLNGTNWYDVDKATFLTGQDVTKTVAKNASGDALTVTWTDLPAYANIESATDQDGDIQDMNDQWIYYTIKEDPINNVITRYSATPYVEGESYTNTDKYKDLVNRTNPFKTEDAPAGDTYAERTYSDVIDHLYVTNWRTETTGTAQVGVVKQYIGKVWEDESFTFEMTPVKSKLGGATEYTTYEDQVAAHETDSSVKVMPTLADNTAEANTGTATVSVNEHAANFNPLTIKLGDLVVDPSDGKEKGEFIYEVKEVIPAGAVEMTEDGKTFWVAKDENGNTIKYTTDTHTVKVLAVDDGSGKIDITVSYDERNAGEFVPVYTNCAMMRTPVEGTKSWIGGPLAEHQNGTVELDDDGNIASATDALGLQLKRILAKDGAEEETLTRDDADRELVIVWVKEVGAKPATPTGYWVNEETGLKITDEEYQQITDEDEKAKYVQEMTPATPASTDPQTGEDASATGSGNSGPYTYTVKAKVTEGETATYVDPILNTVDKDGYVYSYSIKETAEPADYEASESGLNVTNTNDAKDTIKVTKTWDDAQNAEGIRPENVTVHLYKLEGTGDDIVQVEVAKKTISKQTGDDEDVWSTGITWDDLPVYDDEGNVIKYVVIEESETGYTTTYSLDGGDYKSEGDAALQIELDNAKHPATQEEVASGKAAQVSQLIADDPQALDVKNSLVPATDEVKVTKVWNDANDIDGNRPDDVTFQLYKYVWDSELNEGKGAYKETEQLVSGQSGTGRPATQADVDAAKAADPQSTMKVGDIIKIEDLVFDGTADDPIDTQANETGAWAGSWINLPLEENGKTILYVVKEVVGGDAFAAPGTEGKYSNEPCVHGDQIQGFTVTNEYTPITIDIVAEKVWDDARLQALSGVGYERPKTVSFQLKADGTPVGDPIAVSEGSTEGGKAWTCKWEDLPKNKVVEGTSTQIEYTVEELEVPAGYTAAVTGTMADGFTITNTPTVNDAVEADLVLHKIDSVTNVNIPGVVFELKRDNVVKGTYTTDDYGVAHINFEEPFATTGGTYTYTLTEKAPATGYEANETEYQITVKTNGEGKAVVERVELKTPGKNAFEQLFELIVGSPATGWDADNRILTIKNTPKVNKVVVTKTFAVDEGNAIPAELLEDFKISVDYTAVKADGTADPQPKTLKVTGGDIAPTASTDGKTYTWEIAGVAYGTDVHVHEQNYGYVEGYDFDGTEVTASVASATTHDDDATFAMPNADATIGFTNTYREQTGYIRLLKIWDDDGNRDGKRPESIEFTVTATVAGDPDPVPAPVFGEGDEATNTAKVTLTADADATADTWTDEPFSSLPLYYMGKKITYAVDEKVVPDGYAKEIVQSRGIQLVQGEESLLAISNSYEPKTGSVKVTKTWSDENNAAGMRRETLVYLYADGKLVGEVTERTVATTDGEVEAWADLPVYTESGTDGQTKIKYTVKETAIPGYTPAYVPAEVELDAAGGVTSTIAITNSLTPPTTEVAVTKVWDDANNVDGKRPENVTLSVYEYKWTGEGASAGYQKTADAVATITLDADDATTDANIWRGTVTGLAAVKNGKTVIYEVGETPLENYEAPVVTGNQVDGFTVTNSREAEVTELDGYKVWLDGNRSHDTRVEIEDKLKVYRSVDGGETWSEDALVKGTDYQIEWLDARGQEHPFKITGLAKNVGGQACLYKVVEDSINVMEPGKPINQGYTTRYMNVGDFADKTDALYDGGTVYNVQTIDVIVSKRWMDGGNALNTRSATTVTLEKSEDGGQNWETVDTAEVTTRGGYVGGWEKLPAYTFDEETGEVTGQVVYRITEDVTGLHDGYTTNYTLTGMDGQTQDNEIEFSIGSNLPRDFAGRPICAAVFTNSYDVKDSITVTKTWEDENDAEGLRPDEVVVHLYKAPSVELTEDEERAIEEEANDSVDWSEFDVNQNGRLDFDEYPVYMEALEAEYQELRRAKIAEKQADLDPIQVEVEKKTIKKNPNGTWTTATWDNLPVFNAEDELITYIVEEETVAGYTTTYTVDGTTYAADSNKLTLDGVEGTQTVGVKNSLTPETDTVTVTKVWDDNNNVDGKRPEGGIAVKLYAHVWDEETGKYAAEAEAKYADGQTVPTVTLDGRPDEGDAKTKETAAWTATFGDLPGRLNGRTVIYVAKEVTDLTTVGYEPPVITGDQVDGFTITNSREQDMIDVPVEKVWTGDSAEYRPDHIELKLKDGETVVATDIVAGTGDTWTHTFTGLPKNKLVEGVSTPIAYTVEETAINGYATNYGDKTDAQTGVKTLVVTNTATLGKLHIQKTWDDGDNVDGKRPTADQFAANVRVYANGKLVTLTADGSPSTTGNVTTVNFKDVPAYDASGNLIRYMAVEGTFAEYAPVGDVVQTGTIDATSKEATLSFENKYTPGEISVTALKVWDDADNQDAKRPPNVTFRIEESTDGTAWAAVEGQQDKTVSGTEGTDFAATWTGLPTHKLVEGASTDIQYRVIEVAVPAGYTSATEGTAADGFTITNSYTPAVTTVKATKGWYDDNDADGIRPTSVTFQLYADGQAVPGKTITLTADNVDPEEANKWRGELTGLPKYKNGVEIKYSWKEVDGPLFYEVINSAGGALNAHRRFVGCVEAMKIWDDSNNEDGKRTDVTFELKRVVTDAQTGEKSLAPALDEYGKPISSETIYYEENEPYNAVWHNVPVFDNGGEEIEYTVVEADVPDGYKATYYSYAIDDDVDDPIDAADYMEDDGDHVYFFVTNTYEPKPTSLTVTKVWEDGNDQDGMRDDVTLHLMGTIEGSDFQAMDFGAKTIVKSDVDDGEVAGTATWTDLPTHHDGKEITYTVVEDALAGYTATVSDVEANMVQKTNGDGEPLYYDADGAETTAADDGEGTAYAPVMVQDGLKATVTNSRTPAVTTVEATKVWNDVDNIDDSRTDVIIHLDKTINYQTFQDAANPITIKGDAMWRDRIATWTDLPTHENGKQIDYTVREEAVDGYTTQISTREPGKFIVTNTHKPETIEVTVKKTWVGDVEQIRPDHVTVTLKADGQAVTTDADGNKVAPITMVASDWAAGVTFDNLPKNKWINGQRHAIEYTVEETAINGYATTYADDVATTTDGIVAGQNGTITVTNTAIKGTLTLTKTWEDEGDFDSLRPSAAEFLAGMKLYANGEQVTPLADDVTVAASGDTYTITVKNAPVYSNGKLITYTVEEAAIAGYEQTTAPEPVKMDNVDNVWSGAFTITNTHEVGITSVVGTKVWVDGGKTHANATELDGKLILWRQVEGGTAEKVTADAEGTAIQNPTWDGDTYTFAKLPMLENGTGKAYTYWVKEAQVVGYDAPAYADAEGAAADDGAPNEGTITNTITQEYIEIPVTKVWDDNGNQDGVRPATLDLTLLRNGEECATETIADAKGTDSQVVTFTRDNGEGKAKGFEKYDEAGAEYVYTVAEDSSLRDVYGVSYLDADGQPLGPTAEAAPAGGTIVNTHEPEVASITITKAWNDLDNQDGARADAVIQLLANGEQAVDKDGNAIEPVTLATGENHDQAMSATIDNLPVYKDGKPIEYTVSETPIAGYVASVTPDPATLDKDSEITVTNTHEALATSVKVTKVWDDSNNAEGARPQSVNVVLYADGTPVATKGITTPADSETTASVEFTGLPKNRSGAHGEEILYTVKEESVPEGYTSTITGNQHDGYTITNKHGIGRTITVTKIWDDADFADKPNYNRPKDVSVNLFADGQAVGDAVGLSEDNGWTTSWTVPVATDAGAEIKYEVREINVPVGYTYSGDVEVPAFDPENTTFAAEITNTANGEEIINQLEMIVYKTDAANEPQPLAGATFTLTGPDDTTATYTSDADGKLSVPFTKAGSYKLQETGAPSGYTADGTVYEITVDKNAGKMRLDVAKSAWQLIYDLIFGPSDGIANFDPETGTLKVVNTPNPHTLTVTKTYSGIDALPEGFTITVEYQGAAGAWQKAELKAADAQVAGESMTWKVEGIPYGTSVHVTESGYEVAGYRVYGDDPVVISSMGDEDATVEIDNEYELITDHMYIVKWWNDNYDQDGIRPSVEDAAALFTLKADGEPVADVTPHVQVNEEYSDYWVISWYNLPVYNLETGEHITYTVEENVPEGYTAEGSPAALFDTITNTHVPETIDIPSTIVWEDASDAEGVRPASTTVRLFADGVDTGMTIDLTAADVDPNDPNTWTNAAAFAGLPKFKNGQPITYTVKQDMGEGIYAGNYTDSGEGEEGNSYTITNTRGTDLIDIPVTVVWDDVNNQDGLRAGSVTINLFDGNGNPVTDELGNPLTLTLSPENNWTGSFTGLPKRDAAGNEIAYTTSEDGVDPSYAIGYEGNPTTGFTFTNTYKPGVMAITATKAWAGEPETVGSSLRADVVLHLYGTQGGAVVYDAGTQVIPNTPDDATDDVATWTELPEMLEGAPVEWEIVEEPVFGYTSSVAQAVDVEGQPIEGAYVVTNTYAGPVTSVTVTKEWHDDADRDSKRPESVSYELWQKIGDGEAELYDTQVVPVDPATGNAPFIWSDLPATAEVQVGTEPVTRTEIQDVETPVTDEAGNAILDEAGNPVVDLVPTEVEVTEDQPVYEQVAVLYTVKETALPAELGYEEPIIEATAPGVYNVVNARLAFDTVDIEVVKTWADADNADGVRPDFIEIAIREGGGLVLADTLTTADATDANTWRKTYTGLPANSAKGVPCEYLVEETAVDGYGVEYAVDGGTVTIINSRDVATRTLTITKQWLDAEGAPIEVSPADATFHLVKTVQGYGPVRVEGQDYTIPAGTSGEGLVVSWTGLPAMENGLPVEYTVEEDAVDGYTSVVGNGETVDGVTSITVTNTAKPADPEPEPETVPISYVDPLAAGIDAGDPMVKKSTLYPVDQAEAAAKAYEGAPAPSELSHDGYEFVGWNIEQDAAGGYIAVAKYNAVAPPPAKKTVSYVDPQNANPLLVSEFAESAADVAKPADPSHDGLRFVGWEQVTDTAGNIVFVAKYEPVCPECSNGSGTTPSSTPSSGGWNIVPASGSVYTSTTGRAALPETGDATDYALPIAIGAGGAGVLLVGLFARRRKDD